jgi:hypothetical protein
MAAGNRRSHAIAVLQIVEAINLPIQKRLAFAFFVS